MATERTSMTPFGGAVHLGVNRDAMSPFGGVVGSIDLLVGGFSATASDGFNFSDSTKRIAFLKSISQDGFYFSDSISRVAFLSSSVFEGYKFGENSYRFANLLSSLSLDGFKYSDSSTRFANLQKSSAQDGYIFSDEIFRIASHFTSVSDGYKFSDTVYRFAKFFTKITEGFQFADKDKRFAKFLATLVEGYVFSDSASAFTDNIGTVTDGYIFSDSANRFAYHSAKSSDGLKFGDFAKRVAYLFATISEGYIFSDTAKILVELLAFITKTSLERFRLDEVPTLPLVKAFNTGDTVTISVIDLSTGLAVDLSSNTCQEISNTGFFVWSFSSLKIQPTTLTYYSYTMSNGVDEKIDTIDVGGWPEIVGVEKNYFESPKLQIKGGELVLGNNWTPRFEVKTADPDLKVEFKIIDQSGTMINKATSNANGNDDQIILISNLTSSMMYRIFILASETALLKGNYVHAAVKTTLSTGEVLSMRSFKFKVSQTKAINWDEVN